MLCRSFFAIFCAVLSLGVCERLLAQSENSDAQPKRPNFLFILTDDQAQQTLSCYGNTECKTPNIDRLAREGMVIHDAHHMGSWSGAVCRPSRTMIMTGRSVWRIPGTRAPGIDLRGDFPKDAAEQSLPAVFNRAGYVTFRTCKKGNSFNQANNLFQITKDATRRQGNLQNGSAWHGDQMVEFLESRAENKDKPFLAYFGFSHPHDPRNAPPKLAAKYGANNEGPQDVILPNAPKLQINYLPEHPFHHGHPGLRDEVNVQGVMKRRDEATIRNELGREFACIENIDQQIGRVLEKLEEIGELENTYIVFTSDHGIAVGRHGLTGKQNLYEHTWRVPMIVRGPGIQKGSQASGYVYLMDVLPTFCELASIEIPETVESKSFARVLKGQSKRIRDVMYGVYCGGTKPGMRSVKKGDWKLIEYDVLDGEVRETQLFNLADNPHELLVEHHDPAVVKLTGNNPKDHQVNLASDPQYSQKLAEMRALLKTQMEQFGDPYTLSKSPQ